jgi:hypothetical protein
MRLGMGWRVDGKPQQMRPANPQRWARPSSNGTTGSFRNSDRLRCPSAAASARLADGRRYILEPTGPEDLHVP